LVLNLDKISIVGFNLRPDIESTETVGTYKKPISTSADELAAEPRPLERATNYIETPSECLSARRRLPVVGEASRGMSPREPDPGNSFERFVEVSRAYDASSLP
jgi:hypothetical protein